MTDLESQQDEMCVMESIYNNEEFNRQTEDGVTNGQFYAYIDLPPNFYVFFKDLNNEDNSPVQKISLKHLPPISLSFTLPHDYPSKSPPTFHISCPWLSVWSMKKLANKLENLWKENEGIVILYTWTQFLKEETLLFLNIKEHIDLSRKVTADLLRLTRKQENRRYRGNSKEIRRGPSECPKGAEGELQGCSNSGQLEASKQRHNSYRQNSRGNYRGQHNTRYFSRGGFSSYRPREDDRKPRNACTNFSHTHDANNKACDQSSEDKAPPSDGAWKGGENNGKEEVAKKESKFDNRVMVSTPFSISLPDYLAKYSEDRAKTEFGRQVFLCNVCFQDKFGIKCIQFKPCDHVYCKQCVAEYYQVRIRDGSVKSMPCLFEKCSTEASQNQIRDLLGPTLFAHYDTLLLNVTLNTMADITYCPRLACQCPVMREPDDKMAACPSCLFVFCVYCKMTYHGVEPCRFKSEEKKALILEYTNADAEAKLRLESRYGKRQLLNLVQSSMSENWISENSKPCPQCSSAIEKSDGCNKMVCWKCNAFFCWLCGAMLNPHAPYEHFYSSQSKCHNLLFQGMVVDDDLFSDDDDDLLTDEDDEDDV